MPESVGFLQISLMHGHGSYLTVVNTHCNSQQYKNQIWSPWRAARAALARWQGSGLQCIRPRFESTPEQEIFFFQSFLSHAVIINFEKCWLASFAHACGVIGPRAWRIHTYIIVSCHPHHLSVWLHSLRLLRHNYITLITSFCAFSYLVCNQFFPRSFSHYSFNYSSLEIWISPPLAPAHTLLNNNCGIWGNIMQRVMSPKNIVSILSSVE